MSIRYKAVKQVSGFSKTGTGKYAVKTVTDEMLTFNNVYTQVTQACDAHRGTVNQSNRLTAERNSDSINGTV